LALPNAERPHQPKETTMPEATSSDADPTPPSFAQPISAKLARRLAAAADGYRDGKVVWFTASYTPLDGDNGNNFGISEAIPGTGTTAPDLPIPPGYGLFGPFLTTANDRPKKTEILRITVALPDREVVIDASKYDAMFWSSSSVDKFAVPHYATVLDLKMAATLQQDFGQENVYLVLHGPNTEYKLQAVPAQDGPIKILTI
jgi:hypothetical protein